MEIYLDNSATTRVCEAAAAAAANAMRAAYGNPSALHKKGAEALALLTDARKSAAAVLGADSGEIFFSHSGTLANNTAVFGAAQAGKRRGKRIVTTATEHPSVARCMDALETQGFEVIRLAPDGSGSIPETAIAEAVNAQTVLVSIMLVNNETGAINPVEAAARAVKAAKAPALIHCDAVQGFGKLPIRAAKLGADLLTASGHKLHAPKGVGLLYVKKGVRLPNYIYGGGQENNLFSGTENMPAIAGFGAALRELRIAADLEKTKESNALLRGLLAEIPGVEFNSAGTALPYILNFSLRGIPSQVLINFLSAREICVSAGSACKKGHRSDVLTAMGLPPARIDSAVRVSMSRETTAEELRLFAAAVAEAAKTIRTKL